MPMFVSNLYDADAAVLVRHDARANDLRKQSRSLTITAENRPGSIGGAVSHGCFRMHNPCIKSEQTSTSYLNMPWKSDHRTPRGPKRTSISRFCCDAQLGFFNDVPRSGRARRANHG
jgi:hypothetical protein